MVESFCSWLKPQFFLVCNISHGYVWCCFCGKDCFCGGKDYTNCLFVKKFCNTSELQHHAYAHTHEFRTWTNKITRVRELLAILNGRAYASFCFWSLCMCRLQKTFPNISVGYRKIGWCDSPTRDTMMFNVCTLHTLRVYTPCRARGAVWGILEQQLVVLCACWARLNSWRGFRWC